MMNKIDVLKKITEESYIIQSATENFDIDIIEKSIEERQFWIDKFHDAEDVDAVSQKTLETMLKEYKEIDDKILEGMEIFKEKIREAIDESRSAKNEMATANKIKQQYSGIGLETGTEFDTKK